MSLKPHRRATRTDHDMDLIAHRATSAAKIIPSIEDDIAYRLSIVDDKTSSESGRVGGGDPTDPTGDSAARRSAIKANLTRVRDAKKRVAEAMDALDRTCRDALGRSAGPAEEEPRCHGGDPSTWGAPTCGELVELRVRPDGTAAYDRDGLCCHHAMRKSVHDDRAKRAMRARQKRAGYEVVGR